MVQMLRNQIMAEESGKNFRQLYVDRLEKPTSTSPDSFGLTPLQIKDRRAQGLLVNDEVLQNAFNDVMNVLTSKKNITKRFYSSLDTLSNQIDESVIADVGDRIGDGIPLHYIRDYINDQSMADILGLDEFQVKQASKATKVNFARQRLKTLETDTDADICPGYWLVPVTDGQNRFYFGFSVVGYSFSGVNWIPCGAFISESAFISHVCCKLEMFFNGFICNRGKPTLLAQITDTTLLRIFWGK